MDFTPFHQREGGRQERSKCHRPPVMGGRCLFPARGANPGPASSLDTIQENTAAKAYAANAASPEDSPSARASPAEGGFQPDPRRTALLLQKHTLSRESQITTRQGCGELIVRHR